VTAKNDGGMIFHTCNFIQFITGVKDINNMAAETMQEFLEVYEMFQIHKFLTYSAHLMFIGPCIILIVEYRQTNLMSPALLFHYLMLNTFRMLVHPSSGVCDLFVELFHGLYCSGSMCVGFTVLVWYPYAG